MKKNLIFVIIFVFVCLSFTGGYLIAKKDKTVEVVEEIPVPNEFTNNPALQQLNANVKGEIVEKNQEFFTLEDSGRKVTLYYERNGISSFTNKEGGANILYDDLSTGDYLEGGISVIISFDNTIGRTGNRKQGDIIAHSFTVTKK